VELKDEKVFLKVLNEKCGMNTIRIALSWMAKITATIGFLFWVSFFAAHLGEWFIFQFKYSLYGNVE
jgi:hypothetical protein